MRLAAGGALRSLNTTPLIGVEDGLHASSNASKVAEAYRAPR
jgi:uncharacterized protein YaaQ